MAFYTNISNSSAVPFGGKHHVIEQGEIMFWTIILFAVGCIGMVWAIYFAVQKSSLDNIWSSAIIALIAFGFVTFMVSPVDIGYGKVSEKAEPYTKRLEEGEPYQVLASPKDSEDLIVVVKKDSRIPGEVRVIRVKGPNPPQHFTLVNGEPVAIVPPVPPITLSHPLGKK